MATIIGLVGGGGIGTMLIKYQGQAMWPEVGTIIVVIAAVVGLGPSLCIHSRSFKNNMTFEYELLIREHHLDYTVSEQRDLFKSL